MRKVIYNNDEYPVTNDSLTAEQVRQTFADTMYPELSNATAKEEDGVITFELQAGTKGARTVVYNNDEFPVTNDALSAEQVRKTFADTMYPELANATAKEEDGVITFELQAGTKGARTVVYNNDEFPVTNDALSAEQVRKTFADTMYPELANATAKEENGVITFELQAGTKGARTVVYNNDEFPVTNDALSAEQVRKTFADTMYPELANATAKEEDGVITFELQAGTKGARKVVYNNDEYPVTNDDLTAEQVRKTFAETMYPELSNATAKEEDGVITFELQAGTKGN